MSAIVACGDDNTARGDEGTTAEEVSAPDEGSTNAAFCEGFSGIEAAFAEAPEDEAEIPAFVEERIDPNLALIDGNEPTDIAESVQTMTAAVGEVTSTGDFSAFETEELLEMPEDQAEQHIETFAGGTFAPAGAAAGTVTELTPGRWAYVCFIPVGSIGDTEGSGPPHFVEGMAGELTVE